MLGILAWTGGALFAASLAYTVYFYTFVLDNPAPVNARPWMAAGLVNLLLFGLFALHHSVFARAPLKRWVERMMPAPMERSFYVWVASALLIATWIGWQLTAGLVYAIEGPLRWAFYALQLAGVHLTLRSAGMLDALELAGIRQLQPRPRPTVFRTDGPFGLVRHPIYLGWLLMTFGTPLMTVNRLLFATITSAYLILAIPWEERSLVAAFGDRYRAYQARVRWRLVPGLW